LPVPRPAASARLRAPPAFSSLLAGPARARARGPALCGTCRCPPAARSGVRCWLCGAACGLLLLRPVWPSRRAVPPLRGCSTPPPPPPSPPAPAPACLSAAASALPQPRRVNPSPPRRRCHAHAAAIKPSSKVIWRPAAGLAAFAGRADAQGASTWFPFLSGERSAAGPVRAFGGMRTLM